MADPIRLQIANALVSALQNIDGTGSYDTTVTTVELAARSWSDPEVRPETMPYIGVVPQTESWRDIPQYTIVDWPFEILAHAVVTPKTMSRLATVCAQLRSDIKRALYTAPTLNVEGVVFTRVTGGLGSEGATVAVNEGLASVMIRAMVRFQEANP
jgi:hypothetical protein